MHPKMIPVLSSNIDGVAYLADGTLLVAFKSKAVYAYDGVPEDVFRGMTVAQSKGQYLNVVVKKGGYDYRLLDAGEVDALIQSAITLPPVPLPRARMALTTDLMERYLFLRLAF
jgi:hypothetical protein